MKPALTFDLNDMEKLSKAAMGIIVKVYSIGYAEGFKDGQKAPPKKKG